MLPHRQRRGYSRVSVAKLLDAATARHRPPGARLPALGQGLRRGLGPGGGLLGDEGAPTARLQAKDAAGECASGTGSIVVAHVDDFPVSDTEYLDIGKAEVLPPYLSVYFQ